MRVMTKRKYSRREHLDPARSVIRRFCGPHDALAQGIKAVAKIVERDSSSVYRWMLPVEDGGTGGYIPAQAQLRLSEYAKKKRLRIEALNPFGVTEAA